MAAVTKDEEMCLYKIADATLVELSVKGGVAEGEQGITMATTIPGLKLYFTIKVVKMFSYDQTGILFHVAGDLYVLVSHNPLHNTSSAFIINGANSKPESLMQRKFNLKETVAALGDTIVASYYRKAQGFWSPLKLT